MLLDIHKSLIQNFEIQFILKPKLKHRINEIDQYNEIVVVYILVEEFFIYPDEYGITRRASTYHQNYAGLYGLMDCQNFAQLSLGNYFAFWISINKQSF